MAKKRYCNVRRMNKLIAALKTEAAGNMFNMRDYIYIGDKPPREAFKSRGTCGTAACIAGIAAIIAPGFFHIDAEYGFIDIRNNESQCVSDGFAVWLGIPCEQAGDIVSPDSGIWCLYENNDIAHAINVLEAYRDGGMDLVGKIEGVELA